MPDTYLEYVDEDRMIRARWHGGAYIEFGYVAEQDSPIRNNLGQPSHAAGEWVALDVINVYDYAKGETSIPFTPAAMAEAIEEHLSDEDEDDDECVCYRCGEVSAMEDSFPHGDEWLCSDCAKSDGDDFKGDINE